jgi:hypothetical protein
MKLDKTRVKPGRRARVLAGAVLAAAALAALPAAGHAAVLTLGSDLSAPATKVEAHGADSAFWNVFVNGAAGAMPAAGQVTFVRVKGSVLDFPAGHDHKDAPPLDPQFHFQVLHPVGGGQLRVSLSSAPFRLPIVTVFRTEDNVVKGNPQDINGFKPVNLCVEKGDYIDFNDIGGSEWSWGGLDGMHVQVFSDSANSTVNFYSKNQGTNIGSTWPPDPRFNGAGEELLMQTKLATGSDASDICPGGYQQHIFKGLGLRRESVSLSTKKGIVKLHADCPSPTYGGCKGVLVMNANIKGRQVSLGGVPFVVRPAFSTSLELKLSKKNIKLIKKAKKVTAAVTANAHDDPKNDRRANRGIPVQSKTTAGTVTIRSSG